MGVAQIAPDVEVLWDAYPGFQTKALQATEFEVFLGGAKGPGKSDLILVGSTRQVSNPLYKGLVLRETFGELEELILRAHRLFPPMGGVWQAKAQQFRWFDEAKLITGRYYNGHAHQGLVKFGYCARREHAQRYQGGEWCYIGFDELANIAEEHIWEDLLKEIRCKDPDVILFARGSGNPGFKGHAWCKRRFIIPCGKQGERVAHFPVEIPVFEGSRIVGTRVVTRSRRFIPGRVQDNPTYANDPQYMATLHLLPEQRRRQMLYGDWDAGAGLALPEMDEQAHIVKPFEIPEHWDRFAALDWGFRHWWVFTAGAIGPSGRAYVEGTVRGRGMYPPQIAASIISKFPDAPNWHLVSGSDLFSKPLAQGEDVPSRAEEFSGAGLVFAKADDRPGSRVASLNNLRDWLKWRGQGPDESDIEPALAFFDTPGNRWLFEQLRDIPSDPDNPEDALKQNSDPETGDGGDDGYDSLRMAMQTRPYTPPNPDVRPEHHHRIHARWQQLAQRLREREEKDFVVEGLSPEADVELPPDMQGDPWGDVMG